MRAAEAASLFRRLLRAARGMPTANRAAFVARKVRDGFEANRRETDPERVAFLVALGETHLDQIRAQVEHLTAVFADPGVHARV